MPVELCSGQHHLAHRFPANPETATIHASGFIRGIPSQDSAILAMDDELGSMLIPVGGTVPDRDALANIVFVHGIGSSCKTAWGSFPDWLFEDLEKSTKAPVNVWLANYPAEIFRFIFLSPGREDSVTQRGRMLLDKIRAQELARRPVVFIAHSLGGIIVKQMLRSAADARYFPAQGAAGGDVVSLALSTRLVIFLATPHDGASIANLAVALPEVATTALQSLWSTVDWLPFAKPLGFVVKPLLKRAIRLGPFTDALKSGDPNLADLGFWYRNNAPTLGIETKAYCENQDYRLRSGLFKLRTLRVVSNVSADPGVSACEVVPLEGDHASICKPSGRGHDNYGTILSAVKTVLDKCPAFSQTHQASALDVGRRFVYLTELPPADRLTATKNAVRPIELRLNPLRSEVDYDTSDGCATEFATPQPWQLNRAAESRYDLDRVILYAYLAIRGGLPRDEPEMYVRQESERLNRPARAGNQDTSFIPLHYAVRALQRQVDRRQVSLSDHSRLQLTTTQKLVEKSAKSPDEHKDLLDNLDALLSPGT